MPCPLNSSRPAETGSSLIEVLAASALLLVAIAGVLPLFPQSYRQTKTSGRITQLNHLVARQAEHLRSLAYDDDDLSAGIHPAQQNDSTGAKYYPVATWPEQYSLRWRVLDGPTDGVGTPEPNMKTLVIEATFSMRYQTNGDPIVTDESVDVAFGTFLTN